MRLRANTSPTRRSRRRRGMTVVAPLGVAAVVLLGAGTAATAAGTRNAGGTGSRAAVTVGTAAKVTRPAHADRIHAEVLRAGRLTSYPLINGPAGIAAGPDGALWFTNQGGSGGPIGRITTSGQVTSYADPSIYDPAGITAGPDGALWFIDQNNNTIGRITTGGAVTIYTSTGIQTVTRLAAVPNPSSPGQPVTFTARISPGDGGGTVSFSAGTTTIPGCSSRPLKLVSGSIYRATCRTSSLAAGKHRIVATDSGDARYSGSWAAITQTVQRSAPDTG